MSHELMYTSVARGLRPGEHGFCTVAVTQGIPAALTDKLESLCGYRHLFPPSDQNAHLNPVLNSHLRVQVDGRNYHILSRVVDAGLDYSQRTNKFAHHLVLDRSELPVAGPAWLLLQPSVMEAEWNDRNPQILPAGRRIPSGDAPPRPCRRWQEVMGDAGWGGVLASMTTQGRPAYLIFQPGTNPLPLIAESLALLPSAQRWGVTFSTYYLGLPPDISCQWRCLVADSPEVVGILEANSANCIVLDGNQGEPPYGRLVEAARTGRVEQEIEMPSRPVRTTEFIPVAAAALPPTEFVPVAKAALPSFGPNEESSIALHSAPPLSNYFAAPAQLAGVEIPPARSRVGGVVVLSSGLILGLVLMILCVLLIEISSKKSLLGVLTNRDHLAANAQPTSDSSPSADEKKQLEGSTRENGADKGSPDSPANALFEKAKRQAKEAEERAEILEQEKVTLGQALEKAGGIAKATQELLTESNRNNAILRQKLEENRTKQSDPNISQRVLLMHPLRLPDPDADQMLPLHIDVAKPGAMSLLGLPQKINKLSLSPEMDDKDYVVRLGEDVIARFQINLQSNGGLTFEWEKLNSNETDRKKAQLAITRSILRVKIDNGDILYYPLEQRVYYASSMQKVGLDDNNIRFEATLTDKDKVLDPKLDTLVLGETGSVKVDSRTVRLVNRDSILVTDSDKRNSKTDQEKPNPEVELSLDGPKLILKFNDKDIAKKAASCIIKNLIVYREFEDKTDEQSTKQKVPVLIIIAPK